MIMAYDFHKSYGEPGTNFPYEDFKKMINDYLEFVPAEKLTIIFGMYGYDWTLKDGKPLRPAEALTLNQIRSKFSDRIKTDPISREKNISYIDDDGYDHVVFFEDEESAEVKINYLKEKGIGSIAFWAWGYF
jgi:spore germination protein